MPEPSTVPAKGDGPLVRIHKLCVYYHRNPALRDVTIDFPPRSITAVLGPSGTGKSSLLMAINRLTDMIPGCQVQGYLEVEGQNVFDSRHDVTALRRAVGMVFQKPVPFPFSVYRNLEIPLRALGVYRRKDLAERMEHVLRSVGLWDELKDRLHRSALELSGGQQQRLCLARCLVTRPRILLLDEPCSSLDPLSAEIIEQLMLQMRKEYTLVVVTHNLSQAHRLADHVALLWRFPDGGRLVECGPREQFFRHPQQPLTVQYLEGRVG